MIGIDGQYLLSVSCGNNKDFLTEQNLFTFNLMEQTGNILPSLKMSFLTLNERVVSSFQENNSFSVSIGRTANGMIDVPLQITSLVISKSQQGYDVSLTGVYDALPYISQGKFKIYPNKRSVDVIKELTSPYFNWYKGNIINTNDPMNWIQYGISSNLQVNECWLHSDIGKSNDVPLMGITSGGVFIFKSLKSSLGRYVWNFTTSSSVGPNIAIDPDYTVANSTTFNNNWWGYGRQLPIYNFEDGTSDVSEYRKEGTFISLAPNIERDKGISWKTSEARINDDNTHKTYWPSYQKNVTNLVTLSSVNISISFHGQYFPVKVLDYCSFFDSTITSNNPEQSTPIYSGGYFITKVVRQIEQKTLFTNIVLTRESLNKD